MTQPARTPLIMHSGEYRRLLLADAIEYEVRTIHVPVYRGCELRHLETCPRQSDAELRAAVELIRAKEQK